MGKCIFENGDVVAFNLPPAHVAYMKTRKMRETFESLEIKKMMIISTDENGFCTGLVCSNKKSPMPIRVGPYRYFVHFGILLVFSQNMLKYCGIPLGKNDILHEIANRLKKHPPKTTLESVANIPAIDKSSNNNCRKTTYSHRLEGYTLAPADSVYVSPPIRKLKLIDYPIDTCITCGVQLINLVKNIPIHDNRAIKVPLKQCTTCGCFFEEHGERLSILIKNHSYPSDYIASREYLIPNFNKKRNEIRTIPSAAFVIHLKSKNNNNHRLITVVNSKSDQKPEADIFHYSDLFFRKLFLKVRRGGDIIVGNEVFDIIGMFQAGNKNSRLYTRTTIQTITIRNGGGLYTGVSAEAHLVDILLYSPFTDCLEIAHASYDEDNDLYYMDIKLFRWFIQRYGNPGIIISTYHNDREDYDMQEESLLHAYGYNVTQKSGLSDDQRRSILSEVLDLELMSAHSIIALLNHNIKMHSHDKYRFARYRWKADMEYVLNYKVNPKRFIVSDIGVRKTEI